MIRLRTYGVDAAEHGTVAGDLATKLFSEKIASLRNIVWCQFVSEVDEEKFGRTLAALYEDKTMTKPLNNYLVEKSREIGSYLPNLIGEVPKKKF